MAVVGSAQTRPRPRRPAALACIALTALALASSLHAQSGEPLPDAPEQQAPTPAERETALTRQRTAPAAAGSIASLTGIVQDPTGAVVPGALLMLRGVSGGDRAVLADADGQFRMGNLPAGNGTLQASYPGFVTEILAVNLKPDQAAVLQPVVLRLGSSSRVDVFATRHDVAESELKLEVQQRILGIFPNFYVSYIPDAAPLAAGQKLKLAVLDIFDPGDFAAMGAIAGLEQANDSFHGYGQGAQGYGKRFGASFADTAITTTMTAAVFPILLHQDPRYFWKGTGSKRERATYAISRMVITRGDNGRRQPNFSGILGELSAAGLSNLYYPASDRNGAGLTLRNAGFGLLTGAAINLYQEFFSREMTPAAAKLPPSVKTPHRRKK